MTNPGPATSARSTPSGRRQRRRARPRARAADAARSPARRKRDVRRVVAVRGIAGPLERHRRAGCLAQRPLEARERTHQRLRGGLHASIVGCASQPGEALARRSPRAARPTPPRRCRAELRTTPRREAVGNGTPARPRANPSGRRRRRCPGRRGLGAERFPARPGRGRAQLRSASSTRRRTSAPRPGEPESGRRRGSPQRDQRFAVSLSTRCDETVMPSRASAACTSSRAL